MASDCENRLTLYYCSRNHTAFFKNNCIINNLFNIFKWKIVALTYNYKQNDLTVYKQSDLTVYKQNDLTVHYK